jgi:hypothetical protein
MRHCAISLATLTAVLIVAMCAVVAGASGADATPTSGSGAMICDGFTGCYIITDETGALLADCNTPDFSTGPFHCVRTLTASFSATRTIVYTDVVCQTYAQALIYESTRGTIIVRQNGTTVTLDAICPNASAG